MIKKYILGLVLLLSVPALSVLAATPLFTAAGSGDGNLVTVNVSGADGMSPIVLYYNSVTYGTQQSSVVGTTDANGYFSGSVNTSALSVNRSVPVYVMVNGAQSASLTWPYDATGYTGGNNVSFNQNSPNVAVGQVGTIILYGGSGTYYVSSNSNSGAIGTSISGNILTLQGLANGQANIVVCATNGGCGTLTVNSSGSTSTFGAPAVSQTVLTFNLGGQGTVTVSGGTSPYSVSVPAGSGVYTTLVGNTLSVNASAVGTNVINVCSANGGCTSISVNVQPQNQPVTTTTTTGTGGQISIYLPLAVGQSLQLGLSGGIGAYYLQSPMSSPALASITGSVLSLNGQAVGAGTINICQTGGTSCLPISVNVGPAQTGTGGGFFYETDLYVGVSGQDVTELQTRLQSEGYFSATPTGYFGTITRDAVMAYQKAHGISATGYVGPITRADLNK